MPNKNKSLLGTNYDINIAIIGLGYVGLPLAIEFGKKFQTIGFDLDKGRIQDLKNGEDKTKEVMASEFNKAKEITFTADPKLLSKSNIYIVAVPTPLDKNYQPDLSSLKGACQLIGKYLTPNDTVIFESTVYPGATEEICVPILKKFSNLEYIDETNEDENIKGFYCGYSPERINPGDKERDLTSIKKVTSGSTQRIHEMISALYNSIIKVGTIPASSIKIAEAAKVIENTQRDLNIALVNEFALIFNKLGIDTEEILDIASTKWNFVHHQPGLVGGHCIGVDPYYLAHKAIESDYYPQVILSGRETNNKMGSFVANNVVQLMTNQKIQLLKSKVLIMGFTFKEDCPDIRNTKVIDIKNGLEKFKCSVDLYDPLANKEEVKEEYGFQLIQDLKEGSYDAIILAVRHQEFLDIGINKIRKLGKEKHVIFDVKYLFSKEQVDGRL